jgi:hypothetical protein
LALLLFMPVAAAFANFSDGFDYSFPGTVNPPPWQLSALGTDDTAFTGSIVSPTPAGGTPPNAYDIHYTALNTSAGNIAAIVGWLNASSSTVVLNAYLRMGSIPVSLADFYGFIEINAGNDTTFNSSVSFAFDDAYIGNSAWFELTTAMTTTPNSMVTIMVGVEKITGLTYPLGLDFYLDNITVTGANFDLWGAANFRLVDFGTGSLFNIAGYPNSSVYVGYHSGPPQVFTGITSPTLNLTLTNAGLVTVWVGNYYERSLIPNPYAVNVMYLNDPTTVLPYQFNIIDMTGHFGIGSKIYVSYSSVYSDFIVTSGYTDAQSTFSTYLQPGSYQVTIVNGSNTYTQVVTVGGASSTVTLSIVGISITGPGGLTSAVTYGTAWSGTDLVTQFNDTTLSATNVAWTLLQRDYSGTFSVATYSAAGTWGFWQYSFNVTSIGLNTTDAPDLFVTLTITDTFGTYTLGPFAVTVPIGSIFPTNPSFPNSILGMNAVLPQSDAWIQFGIAMIVIVLASAFASRAAPFGILVVSVAAAFFGYAGWLPIGDSLISIIVPIAVMMIMVAKQRGTGM